MYKLTLQNRTALWDYLCHEPEMNLFFLGDLENFGFESENVEFYAMDRSDKKDFDCVLLRYHDHFQLYSIYEDYDAEAVAAFLSTFPEVLDLNGKENVISRIAHFFPKFTMRPTYMSRCNQILTDAPLPDGITIRTLENSDAAAAIDMYLLIDEFAKTYRNQREKQIALLQESIARGELILGAFQADDQIAALGQTTAAYSESAMIIGIAAHPEMRGQGIASALVSELCTRTFANGCKYICLFYDNPKAGAIYRRIGFTEIGKYVMFR